MEIHQCFEILRLDHNASIDDAKEAHKTLAFLWHPDRYATRPLKIQKRAEREMQKINVAYETLVSYLSAEQEKRRQAEEARARAKAAAEEKAEEAQAEVRSPAEEKTLYRLYIEIGIQKVTFAASVLVTLYRKIGIQKVIFAASVLVICSLLIVGYTMHGKLTTIFSESEDSPISSNDTKGSSSQDKGHAEIAPSVPTSHRTEPAVAVLEMSESYKLEAGIEALEEERFAEAVNIFEEILASDPYMINKVSAPYTQALQGQASRLAKTDPHKAKALLLTSVEIEPASVQGHFQLGFIYVRLKDYPRAIETYQKAAELDPQFPETFFNLGYVYAILKDYSRAKEMYSRVVELAPSFLDDALFNLAVVQEKLGEREKSIKNLEQAITVNPENELAKKYLKRLKRK